MLIDLGDITDPDAPVPVGRRRLPARSYRQAIAALVVALVAITTVTASDRGPAGPLSFAGSIPIASDAQLMVTGSQAVILDATAPDVTISAYALPGGRHLWSSMLTVADSGATMMVVGRTVVLDERRPEVLDRGQNLDEGFDLATGQRLWTYPSDRTWETAAGLVIAVETSPFQNDALSNPQLAPDPQLAPVEVVELVDPATGRIRWSRPMADGCDVTPVNANGSTPVRGLVEMCPGTQELIGIDVTTGAISARRTVDLAGVTSPYVVTIRPELVFAGTVTLAAIQDSANIVLSAFRTSDFTPLWSGFPVGAGFQVVACGPDLCIDDGSGTRSGVDPITGAKVAEPPSEHAAGGSAAAVSFVARFGIDEIIVMPPGETAVLASYPVTIDFEPTTGAGQAVTIPEWSSDHDPDLWVAEQVKTGPTVSVQPLGLLHHVDEACVAVQSDAAHRYLACATSADRISMWQLG